ncbi:hypothetical protein [Comamonas odontotermitis]|uniref:hypothetical protein n=1 Tax=Comamonas odontotermitis TaxID=379895 RepID=UPI001CC6B076|nr:hypothetical protein [Comamonas odontotermitis]UBB16079.1 hypothetical protein LAD35_14740 [Comamonas odontotermitis]
MARIAYSFEDGFERPIEDLMWNVILLVLSGGWYPEWPRRQYQLITAAIAKHDLESLLADVPTDEVEVFRHDLKILKLI